MEEYVLIVASVSKEVSHHIISIEYSWGSLKKLKDLYDSHSKLELILVEALQPRVEG